MYCGQKDKIQEKIEKNLNVEKNVDLIMLSSVFNLASRMFASLSFANY